MHIQPAESAHIKELLRLLGQVLQVHHSIRPDLFRPVATKYNADGLTALLKDPATPIFVALEGGQVLGYCFCQLRSYDGQNAFSARQELYIDDLCVDEAHRGRGIATALYQYVTRFAKDAGCAYITLNVWCGNEGAMKFYENAGLTPRSITMESKLC